MKIHLAIIMLCSISYSFAHAELTGHTKSAWVANYIPACFKLQREMPLNSLLSDERLSKYCTCMGLTASRNENIDNEFITRVIKKEASYPADMNSTAAKYCGTNWDKFHSGAISHQIDLSGHGLFDGRVRRFTAFRQFIFNKEWVHLETNELANGAMIMDVNIQTDRSENIATDVTKSVSYKLEKVDNLPDFAKRLGYDFQYKNSDSGLVLTFKTEQGLLTTDYFNKETGKVHQTHYIDTNILICTSLNAVKNKIQGSVLTAVIKEALLIAIKSRAGASYSGGNFYGTTSNGTAVNGTYTQYDNSWLGEHYSRGLEAVFDGTATVSQINDELSKLNCR